MPMSYKRVRDKRVVSSKMLQFSELEFSSLQFSLIYRDWPGVAWCYLRLGVSEIIL